MSHEETKYSSRIERFSGLPKRVTALLENESDRGAILILGAYVEEMLSLIVSLSCTTEKLGEELLTFRKPGGDFSSKILLCEAFGLISPDEARAANFLRKVRNNAAHFDQKGRGFDVLFDSQKTIQQISTFLGALNLELNSGDPKEIKKMFIVAARLLSTKLTFRILEARRATVPKTVKDTADEWREREKGTEIGKIVAEAERAAQDGDPKKLFDIMQAATKGLKKAADRAMSESSGQAEYQKAD